MYDNVNDLPIRVLARERSLGCGSGSLRPGCGENVLGLGECGMHVSWWSGGVRKAAKRDGVRFRRRLPRSPHGHLTWTASACHPVALDAAPAHTAVWYSFLVEITNIGRNLIGSPRLIGCSQPAGRVPPHRAHHRVLRLRQEHLPGRNRRLMFRLCDGSDVVETIAEKFVELCRARSCSVYEAGQRVGEAMHVSFLGCCSAPATSQGCAISTVRCALQSGAVVCVACVKQSVVANVAVWSREAN